MTTVPVVQPRRAWRVRQAVWQIGAYVALGSAALLPRIVDLGGFLTGDEANFWLRRSELFLAAITSGNVAATAITDQPGVTTMWLGSAGIVLRRVLSAWKLLPNEAFSTVLALMRLPAALVHSGAILVGYMLLQRLVPRRMALFGAFLWAVDPFVIAYSRVLHVDALAGTFITLSFLAACAYWLDRPDRRMLVLSGVCGALAVVSKSPALIIAPVVVLVALLANGRRSFTLPGAAALLRSLLGWAIVAGLTALVVWPALWANPREVWYQIMLGIFGEGAQPHQLGNFFLGREDPVPGFAFYPVALALRLTPWTLTGLLLLPLIWRVKPHGKAHTTLAAGAGYIILFVLVMSIFPKKFNRYLVPVFPVADILAAAGWVWAAGWLGALFQRRTRAAVVLARALRYGVLSSIALAAAFNLIIWQPYYILAANQMLGGATTGADTFMTGWGEGLEQAAAWLNEQPNITGVLTVSTVIYELQPYLKAGAQATGPENGQLPDRSGYVVIYKRQAQLNQLPPPFDQFFNRVPPLHVVRLRGIEYVWIYEAPPPVDQQINATFGDRITLRGYRLAKTVQPGATVPLTLVWTPQAQIPANTMLFVHVIGSDTERRAQIDLPYPLPDWRADRYTTVTVPLALPPDAPPGSYRVVIGMYDAQTGQRLSLADVAEIDPALDGPDALPLVTLRVQ